MGQVVRLVGWALHIALMGRMHVYKDVDVYISSSTTTTACIRFTNTYVGRSWEHVKHTHNAMTLPLSLPTFPAARLHMHSQVTVT